MSTYEITAEDFYANYRECKPGDDDTCMSLCDTSEPVLDSICTYVSRGARAAFARRARARRHRLNSQRRAPCPRALARARRAQHSYRCYPGIGNTSDYGTRYDGACDCNRYFGCHGPTCSEYGKSGTIFWILGGGWQCIVLLLAVWL